MKTIKLILDNLPKETYKELMYAFEHDTTQYIRLEDNKYIGVNTSHLGFLSIEQCAGNFYYGEICQNLKC